MAKIKINHKKTFIKRYFLKVVLLLTSIILTILFIYFYWWSSGNEVKIPSVLNPNQNADKNENPVTTDDKANHVVPSLNPRFLKFDSLGIQKARIFAVGLDKDGRVSTPNGIFDVGWYKESGLQGQNKKVILLDGHNTGTRQDGIFINLPKVAIGTEFSIERGDGMISNYEVIDNITLNTTDFNAEKMQDIMKIRNDKETVVIISCSGKWSNQLNTFDKRTVLIANLK